MSDQNVDRRRPIGRRRWLLVGGVVLLLMLGFVGWLGVVGLRSQAALSAARDHLGQAKTALVSGDGATAAQKLELASNDAARARSTMSGLPWRAAASLPYLGRPFRTAQDLAQVVGDLVVQVLQPVAKAGSVLSPAQLRPSGGQINLAALIAAREPLAAASAAADALDVRAQAIAAAGYIPAVEDARRTLQSEVAGLAHQLAAANVAAKLLPTMLGGDRPRTYLVVFQTNAEARGTGGIVGGYGVLTADRGRVTLDTLASNLDLQPGRPPGIDLGPDYAEQYAGYNSTTVWQNGNSSPHFPYAAQIWSSLWEQQGGRRLDGVIGLDPVALSYILGSIGPVTLPGGEVINADNVVPITLSESYARFRDDNRARKAYLQSIASVVAGKILGGGGSTPALLAALGRATNETRLAVWSAVPEEQEVLASTALGHVVPETAGPYASVVVLNGAANKLDYYLGRTLSYVAGDCSAPARQSLVTVDFNNAAPLQPLPEYVTGRVDQDRAGLSPNTNRLLVALYATNGAQLRAVTVDGVATTARIGVERGHPVFTATLLIPPGASQRLVFDLVEPRSAGRPVVPVQPLVRPMGVTVAVPRCS